MSVLRKFWLSQPPRYPSSMGAVQRAMKYFSTVSTLTTHSIRQSAGRALILLKERHPLRLHLALAALIYLGAGRLAAGGGDAVEFVFSRGAAAGIASIFCLFLIFRLSDELKDMAADRALFPDRPLPSGRVLPFDALLMMGLAIAAVIVLNAHRGAALLAALLVVGYILLLHFYLFIPRILLARPVLNLAFHNPVFAAIAFYAVTAATVLNDRPLGGLDPSLVGLFMLSTWLPFLSWELLRKVAGGRAQPDYDVYAPVLGRLGSLFVAATAQTLALVMFVVLATRLGLPAATASVPLLGCLYAGFGYGSFLWASRRGANRLKHSAEAFLACLPGGLGLGLIFLP